jgi:hypothetical protein
VRTTYGRGSEVLPALGRFFGLLYHLFAERSYHVIVQTTRAFDSGGAAKHFFDAAADVPGHHRLGCRPALVRRAGRHAGARATWATSSGPPPASGTRARAESHDADGDRLALTQFILPDGAFGLDIFLRWITMLDALDHIRERPLGETLSRITPSQARNLRRRSPICR